MSWRLYLYQAGSHGWSLQPCGDPHADNIKLRTKIQYETFYRTRANPHPEPSNNISVQCILFSISCSVLSTSYLVCCIYLYFIRRRTARIFFIKASKLEMPLNTHAWNKRITPFWSGTPQRDKRTDTLFLKNSWNWNSE